MTFLNFAAFLSLLLLIYTFALFVVIDGKNACLWCNQFVSIIANRHARKLAAPSRGLLFCINKFIYACSAQLFTQANSNPTIKPIRIPNRTLAFVLNQRKIKFAREHKMSL